jgi:hypothetical protein
MSALYGASSPQSAMGLMAGGILVIWVIARRLVSTKRKRIKNNAQRKNP